jgi:ParB family protein of integrating conjugative element (PFGI_1 class)
MTPVGDHIPGQMRPSADTQRNEPAPSHDNTAVTLQLPVSHIHAYDRNPRSVENPEYERIKASIRGQGIDQPLSVTRRPGETGYMIYAGGNTRLRILQELYEETGEERYHEVTCIYHPWTQETDVLVAHLRENDLRGDLTFVDKASAVSELKRLLEQEPGAGGISQTRLTETLRDRGYALSQGMVSHMAYTVERLLPLLPAALRSGMGRPQVERIRQLERATRTLWLDRVVDTEDEFDQAFSALCRRYDSPDWDIANLRRALEAEIAERADTSIHTVSMALEGYLLGRNSEAGARWLSENQALDHGVTCSGSERTAALETSDAPAMPQPAGRADDQRLREDDQPLPNASGGTPALSDTDGDNEASTEGGRDTGRVDDSAQPKNERHRPTDLKSLRAKAWTLASRLAQRNGLSELVQPLSGSGLGYLLRDVPDPALVDQLNEDTLAQVCMVWWYLAAAAEMTVAPVEHLLADLAEDSVLRRALEDQDAGLLFSSVWTLDPGHMGFRLWRKLDERDWRDLVDLMETYRALHRWAEAAGDPLWR